MDPITGWLANKLAAPLLGGGMLLALGGLGLTWWHLHQANGQITTLTVEKLEAEKALAMTQTALAQFGEQVERDRAEATAKALHDSMDLQAKLDTAHSDLIASQAKAQRAINEHLRVLHVLPLPNETACSVPSNVRDALRRMREYQLNGAPAAAPAG